MNEDRITQLIAEAIGCPDWIGTYCDSKSVDDCYCRLGAKNILAELNQRENTGIES